MEAELTTNPENRKETGRNEDGTFKAGVSGNPGGRPKGTLKDYVRRMFMDMDDEEKIAWLKANKISGETIWKMGEGNPETKSEVKQETTIMPVLVKFLNNKDATNNDRDTD